MLSQLSYPPILYSWGFSLAATSQAQASTPRVAPAIRVVRILYHHLRICEDPGAIFCPVLEGTLQSIFAPRDHGQPAESPHDASKGRFRQPYFRGRCRGNGASQRNTLAVDPLIQGDTDLLAGVNQVRILDDFPVGFEDARVEGAFAIVLGSDA
jgi:hypothetical protein